MRTQTTSDRAENNFGGLAEADGDRGFLREFGDSRHAVSFVPVSDPTNPSSEREGFR